MTIKIVSAVLKANNIAIKVLKGRTSSELLGQEITGRGMFLSRARPAVNLNCGGRGIGTHHTSFHAVYVHIVHA